MNEHIWRWFDDGQIGDALLGRDGCFIPDVTNRDRHDDVLVVRQLVLWGDARQRSDELADALQAAVSEAVAAGDLRSGFGLAWAAVIVGDDLDRPILDGARSFDLLDDAIRRWDRSDPEVDAIAEVLLPRLRP